MNPLALLIEGPSLFVRWKPTVDAGPVGTCAHPGTTRASGPSTEDSLWLGGRKRRASGIIGAVTFEEAMGRLGDRVGTRVRVAVGGRSPMIAADAVGTLATGWPFEQLGVVRENLPDETVHAFGFEEAPGVRIYFSADDFRGAQLTGDHLTIQASEDIEVTVEPAVE